MPIPPIRAIHLLRSVSPARWLARVDPQGSGRLLGARLLLAYTLAAGAVGPLARLMNWPVDPALPLGLATGGVALWATASEAAPTRRQGALQLLAFSAAACAGLVVFTLLAPALMHRGRHGPELALVAGAFGVAFLRRCQPLLAGIGSQFYIGEVMAYGAAPQVFEPRWIALLGLVALGAALAGRLLLHGPTATAPAPTWPLQARSRLGLQAAISALAVIGLDMLLDLREPVWAITACTYVIAGSREDTFLRGRHRMLGNCVGVLAGLAVLPLVEQLPVLAWGLAAGATMVYALSNAVRYDIACAAYSFTLVLTLAAAGEHSVALLASRAWETLLGSALALLCAHGVLPLRTPPLAAAAKA